ncbi:MAG: putative lysine decarboxylase [Methanosaeta sp. PtaU1.Bin112]|nr:MAG: putative lysine decarboxylase [Methanosaeta sp. PtaU1.Bin112]
MQIAVVGGGACSPEFRDAARRIGQIIASHGHVLICGGLGGVMEAACCGAREAGGLTVGILPGEMQEANSCVDVGIATGMGHARNVIIVKSADLVIALPGEMGTLSEMALAMKMKKPVISLSSWEICGAFQAKDPEEVEQLLAKIDSSQKEPGQEALSQREQEAQ